MDQVSCKIIEDLLPLYVEGICSEESRRMVEEHLKGCEACRKTLEALRMDPGVSLPQPEVKKEKKILDEAARKWRKKVWRTFLKGAGAAMAVTACLGGIYFCLFCWPVCPITMDDFVLTVEEPEDLPGVVLFNLEMTDGYVGCSAKIIEGEDNSLYYSYYRTIVKERAKGNPFIDREKVTYGIDYASEGIEAIYYGTPDNGELIWSK